MCGLKERYDSCERLLGASHLITMSVSNKTHKPLIVTLNSPPGGAKKNASQRGKVAAGHASLPRTTAAFGEGSSSVRCN